MKKKLTSILLIILLITSTLSNASLSQSDIGAAATGLGATSVLLALATGATVLATGGIPLLAVGFALIINSQNGSSSTPQNSPLTIYLNPKTPLITPPGWTPPLSPSIQPTPPSTSLKSETFNLAGISATTGLGVCIAAKTSWCGSACTGIVFTPQTPTSGKCTGSENGSNYDATAYKQNTCPPGYDDNGTNCILTNSQLVQKPEKGKMEITRVGNQFQLDPRINPNDIIPSPTVTINPTQVKINHNDGSSTSANIKPDGTSTTIINSPNSNNTTTTTTINYSQPDTTTGNVKVTGTSQTTGQGTGDLGSTTPPPLQLDISSLNKESTQQSINSEIKKLNDYMKCDNCTLPENKSVQDKKKLDDEIKKSVDELDKATDDYNNFKNFGWSTWVPTFPTGSCSPMVGSIRSQNVSWNFCPYVAQMNELLGWLLNLFGAWTITGMFFRRE